MVRNNGSATQKPQAPNSRSTNNAMPISGGPYLKIQGVSKRYTRNVRVLNNINIEVEQGELVALLGPSGCGKTTLLNVIAGFLTANDGKIVVNGSDISDVPPHKRDMPMVFQDYALIPNMSVLDNVKFGLKQRKLRREQINEDAAEALKLVRMSGYENRRPAELSGGQQQRVAVARALAVKPSVLLLDEPLSNLDALLRVSMRDELKSILRTVGSASILVTHDQEEAIAFADKIILLNDGIVEQQGAPEQLYSQPESIFAAQFMGFDNFIPINEIRSDSTSCCVQTALGRFELHGTHPHKVNNDSKLVIRSHDLWVSERASTDRDIAVNDAVQSVNALVVSNSFLGHVNQLSLECEGINVSVADGSPFARTITTGQSVQLNWRPDVGRLVS